MALAKRKYRGMDTRYASLDTRAGREFGQGFIFHRSREAKVRQAKIGGFRLRFVIKSDLAFSLDQRMRVAYVSLELAKHFRDCLLRGLRPDGTPLPIAKHSTLRQDETDKTISARKRMTVGARTGWMAEHWLLLAVRGHALGARRTLKPNGGAGGTAPTRTLRRGENPERSFVINKLLDDGVDFQGVSGAAAKIIADADTAWLEHTLGTPQELWSAPPQALLAATTLDKAPTI